MDSVSTNGVGNLFMAVQDIGLRVCGEWAVCFDELFVSSWADLMGGGGPWAFYTGNLTHDRAV
jgi:hypothetical protein